MSLSQAGRRRRGLRRLRDEPELGREPQAPMPGCCCAKTQEESVARWPGLYTVTETVILGPAAVTVIVSTGPSLHWRLPDARAAIRHRAM